MSDVAHGGWCVARPDDGPVLFVRHALPGETVRARITEVTSQLARADAVEILTPSPDRVEPPCPHAHPGGCGGCDWQHATLPAQRSLKAAVIRQQLRRLAGIDREVTVEPLPGDDMPGRCPRRRRNRPHRPGLADAGAVRGAAGRGGRAAGAPLARGHRRRRMPDRPPRHHRSRPSPPALARHDLGRGPGRRRSGERAAVVTPGGRHRPGEIGPAGSSVPKPTRSRGGSRLLAPAGPNRSLTPVRGRSYLSQRADGRDWRVSAGVFWQVHPAAADALTDAVMTALEPGPVTPRSTCTAGRGCSPGRWPRPWAGRDRDRRRGRHRRGPGRPAQPARMALGAGTQG